MDLMKLLIELYLEQEGITAEVETVEISKDKTA